MIRFGTGGWRAIIGDGFTKQNVQLITTAMAHKIKEEQLDHKTVVLGYDRRFLSGEAAAWAGEILAGEGIPCSIINRESPTPLIMFEVEKKQLAYGMAITASHNPAIYNGIKVFMEGGRDADEELTESLERYIAKIQPEDLRPIAYEQALAEGKIQLIDPINEYVDAILAAVDVEAIRRKRLHVVLDPMYGVSKTAMETILYAARCEVDTIHERRDTLFGGRMPAPTEKTLAGLVNYVEENHPDIGLATDGDADRLGVVDDRAEFLHPNKVLSLLYYYLLEYKGWRGPVVRNIATTHLLDKIAASFGQECYEVPVGFKHVSSKMLETGAIIGGESSGGLTVKGHIRGKDGIYAATLLVEMLAVTGKKISRLWKEIQQRYGTVEMLERSYCFSPQKKEQILQQLMLQRRLPEFPAPVARVSYHDGCKVYFENGGWVIARFSGTEPLLRIFCEMENFTAAADVIHRLEDFLQL